MDLTKSGKTIAELRKQAGYTQASLAEKLGVSDKAVSKWERGIACPDVELWNKLSILLDTDIESIIYGFTGESIWKGMLILDNSFDPTTTIYDKPLIEYLISQFVLVGITDILIIGKCKPFSCEGLSLNFYSEVPDVNHKFTFTIFGNYFIFGPNLTRHFLRAMSHLDSKTILCSMKHRGSHPVGINQDKMITGVSSGNLNRYYAEPFVFYSTDNCAIDFEKTLEESNVKAELMVRGMLIFHINDNDSALELANFVKMYENKQGERIACLDEILIRRGVLSFPKDTKDKYINSLFG